MVDRFSQHIHIRAGGLGDWCAVCAPGERHRALETKIREDSYRTVIDRLVLLENLQRRQNPSVARAAREDVAWVQERRRNFTEKGEDRRL